MLYLELLKEDDRNQFILDNQEAFKFGALVEFGRRNEEFEEDGEIISRKTIEDSIDKGIAYRIILNGKKVGGLVLNIGEEKGELELLFVKPECHSKGIGYEAWCKVEKLYPQIKVWETMTPYFETRNIHFYVNRCGFHIVEFFNPYHYYNSKKPDNVENENKFEDGMFRFQKQI